MKKKHTRVTLLHVIEPCLPTALIDLSGLTHRLTASLTKSHLLPPFGPSPPTRHEHSLPSPALSTYCPPAHAALTTS